MRRVLLTVFRKASLVPGPSSGRSLAHVFPESVASLAHQAASASTQYTIISGRAPACSLSSSERPILQPLLQLRRCVVLQQFMQSCSAFTLDVRVFRVFVWCGGPH